MSDLRHADHERLGDDLAAYALGALPASEAKELERHLETCESCRSRVRWLAPAVDLLPAAVPQHTPPESLRANLMETVRAEAAPTSANERSPRPRRASRWHGVRSLVLRPATGFAVALIAIGIGTGYVLRGEGGEPVASTSIEAKALSGFQVSATLERHGESATLHVNEMPKLDRDEVYEVWVQRAGVLEPTSLFVLDRNGSAVAAVPGPLRGAEAVLVTREPRGGSQTPTTDPLLMVSLL